MSQLRVAALDYAAQGIPVFPLWPRGKAPRIPRAHPAGHPCRGECGRPGHGLYDATTDAALIWRWWRRWPGANIGIPTGPASGWLAVDLDGAAGEASWLALERAYGPVVTLQSRTGRGRHLLFTYPDGRELGNTSGKLGPRIDTRGDGGYVVVPPSVHPTGQVYRWSQDMRHGLYGPQEPPSWLLERLEPPAPATAPSSRARGEYVDRAVPSRLPRHLAQLANRDPARRGRGAWHLIASAIEWGLPDGEIHALAQAHQATAEKYGERLAAEVDRIIGKLRPDHRHIGRPCDAASCPNAPRWMGVSA